MARNSMINLRNEWTARVSYSADRNSVVVDHSGVRRITSMNPICENHMPRCRSHHFGLNYIENSIEKGRKTLFCFVMEKEIIEEGHGEQTGRATRRLQKQKKDNPNEGYSFFLNYTKVQQFLKIESGPFDDYGDIKSIEPLFTMRVTRLPITCNNQSCQIVVRSDSCHSYLENQRVKLSLIIN